MIGIEEKAWSSLRIVSSDDATALSCRRYTELIRRIANQATVAATAWLLPLTRGDEIGDRGDILRFCQLDHAAQQGRALSAIIGSHPTSVDFPCDPISGPIVNDRAMHAPAAPRDPAGKIAKYHLDRRFHRRALRPRQAVAATVALIAIVGSIPYIAPAVKAVASSLETILSEDQASPPIPIIGDIALIVTLADGGVRGAVRKPARPMRRSISTADAGGCHRIHHQAGCLHRRRRIRSCSGCLHRLTDR